MRLSALLSDISLCGKILQVYFRVNSCEWNIYRRYSQFRQFHLKMCKTDTKFIEFDFPRKKAVGKKVSAVFITMSFQDIFTYFIQTFVAESAENFSPDFFTF